ncbi:MAG TPA: 1-deoxy-D-xylulose-5-phosphate synthase N-terminal domain-containing protein [Tepidisphaeraceae bacterium]|jgi:transketolase|nr:1-deoxy-D-xylulose-5-phosphate synthase N-terminal domain-containing protein [Tepidisphaeraceae bacterium]
MNSDAGIRELRRRAKLRLLRMHYESNVGHIGGNLSVLDIMLTLHHQVLRADVDEFILSKGHAAGAWYVTLWSLGLLSEEDLVRFHKDGTRLAGHPPARGIPAVSFATGSLGHGLSLAAGLALAKRVKSESGRVFCVTSDGEWNEGSTWEALIFVAHQRLRNLVVFVDVNGLQGFGTTREVANLEPLAAKLETFDIVVREIDGHDPDAISEAVREDGSAGRPIFILAKTCKGCGVSFLEHRMDSHYLPMNEAQYRQAVDDVTRS